MIPVLVCMLLCDMIMYCQVSESLYFKCEVNEITSLLQPNLPAAEQKRLHTDCFQLVLFYTFHKVRTR